ncbi:MAG: PC4/YdbC family ssDNA-binding protein, partial [Anaerovorax sp.]
VLLMLRTNNKMIQSMMDQSENDKKFKDALISKVLNSEDDSDEKEKNNEEEKQPVKEKEKATGRDREKEKDREVTFQVEEHIGILGTNKSTGWSKELNLVSWNGTPAKYDIRDWEKSHKVMSRGVTLHKDEAQTLKELLNGLEIM